MASGSRELLVLWRNSRFYGKALSCMADSMGKRCQMAKLLFNGKALVYMVTVKRTAGPQNQTDLGHLRNSKLNKFSNSSNCRNGWPQVTVGCMKEELGWSRSSSVSRGMLNKSDLVLWFFLLVFMLLSFVFTGPISLFSTTCTWFWFVLNVMERCIQIVRLILNKK